jgi:hypothetical protein
MPEIDLREEIESRGWRLDPDYGDLCGDEPDTFYLWNGDDIIGVGQSLGEAYRDAMRTVFWDPAG